MTRRKFLALMGAGVGSAHGSLGTAAALAQQPATTLPAATTTRQPSDNAADAGVWRVLPGEKSQVVEVRSSHVVSTHGIHLRRLSEMMSLALGQVTEKDNDADAWHCLLQPDDVIGLKFNSSAADALWTTEPFAQALVSSLTRAGWPPEQIVLIETDARLVRQFKTRPQALGWQGTPTRFASGSDQLASVLDQVTAIVNVPFLKANPIAGMSGCLKNLSHGLIRHPARFHANPAAVPEKGIFKRGRHCAPYIGDIVACEPIRSKLRLHLVDALRTVCEPMFRPTSADIDACGAILAGRDPVAIDMIGLEILNNQRRAHNLPPLTKRDEPLPQLRAACAAGVGAWQPDFIELITAHV